MPVDHWAAVIKGKSMLRSAIRIGAATFGAHRWPVRGPRLWILMYHRILPSTDPRTQAEEPGMIVTPETFAKHVRWLKESFDLIHLDEWVSRVEVGLSVPRRACAITFDDGWRDNYEFAFPIIKEAAVPVTLFVVSHMVGTTAAFWPNRVARVLQSLGSDEGFDRSLDWLTKWLPRGRAVDREAISEVIRRLKVMSDAEIIERLEVAERALQVKPISDRSLVDWEELREMVDSGLVSVGSHSANHRRLDATATHEELWHEIVGSREMIERQIGRTPKVFCYPNGDVTLQALTLVQQYYSAAVTTRHGRNSRASSKHALKRIGLHEDISGNDVSLSARMSGWI